MNRLIICLLTISYSVFLLSCNNCTESAKVYEEAKEKIDHKEYEEGILLLKSVRECDNSDSVNYLIANGYYFQQKQELLDSAVYYYGQALTINKNHKGALYNLSALYNSIGMCEYSLPMLLHLQKMDPDIVGLNNSLANTYECLKNPSLELEYRNRALKTDVELFNDVGYKLDLLKARGIAYLKTGNLDAAIKDFDFLLEHRNTDAEVFYRRGIAWITLGDTAQGCSDLSEAVKLQYSQALSLKEMYCR